jgi:iron complex outermembrane receptor protein
MALFTGALLVAPAAAQQLAANNQTLVGGAGELETVVVTGTAFDANVAPAKASLDTMEPQTIIDKSYIQDSIANTADYTTILAIAPSMTGMDINGPGLSDGNVKNTLRGLPDGDFGLNYDGIPFGDTNGPTHHSESYFPASTIGSIDVDRGPGNAGNLGAATFGGSINMFSEALVPDQRFRASASYGSWDTTDLNLNYQSGDIDTGGSTTRVLANVQNINSEGYLTLQSTAHSNYLVKVQNEFAPGWTITLFGNYNDLTQDLNDNNGETAAQAIAFGKDFALQNTNTNLGTYVGFNYIRKKTDNDYVRLQGDLGNGFTIDDTAYTYAYINKTQTATSVEQTAAEIAAGVTDGSGTIVNGVAHPNDVPGYTKLNAYRVWGNILRTAKDFDFGWLTGQLRAGIWWEGQGTERARFDYDLTQCLATHCNTFKADFNVVGDATLAKAKTPTALLIPSGYAEYVEHSDWDQYQPFVELELHPLDGLTITPGFKYVDWSRNIAGEPEQKTKPKIDFTGSATTTHDLPFLMANYKLEQSWSVYAQYAQGIYVPDISSFEQATPTFTYPKAETTTNYQFGTVYYADNFTFDADVYYIGINNNITTTPCGPLGGPTGDTCYVNTGTATYKGIEGEGTYAFGENEFDGALDGLAVFLNGSLVSGKSGGLWLKNVPMWTAAGGLIYKIGEIKLSLIDKLVGQQYSDNADSRFYKINAYNNTDFKGSVSIGNMEVGVGIFNLFNDRDLLAVTINDKNPIGGASVYDIAARGASLDQYYWAPSRSYQVTLTAHL